MSYYFWPAPLWFDRTLCCRYQVVRFDKLRIPTLKYGEPVGTEWYWALGFFADGQCEVLGAWRDDGAETAQRIAADINARGLERIEAVAAEDGLVEAMAGLRPKVGSRSTAEFAESLDCGPRIRRAARWTDAAAQHLQARMSSLAERQAPFADQAAAANFIARAFQCADRDFLQDWCSRKHPAPYGQAAFLAAPAKA